MEFTRELIEVYMAKKREIDLLCDEEINSMIINNRKNREHLSEIEQFGFSYALLKKDYIDEAYGYINERFMKIASIAHRKGENVFYRWIDDFCCGAVCCGCTEECIGSGGGCCCGLFVIAFCIEECCGCGCGMSCLDNLGLGLCHCCGCDSCCHCS